MKQIYLDRDLGGIYLDRDPEDAPVLMYCSHSLSSHCLMAEIAINTISGLRYPDRYPDHFAPCYGINILAPCCTILHFVMHCH